MPTWRPDPIFYPSPRSAMQAPAETLAYVVQVNPTGALVGPELTRAGDTAKKIRKVCRRQGSGCEAEARAQCAGNDTCLNAVLPCCALLAQCRGREAAECFLSG